jgi:hypothetical protein
MRLCKAFKGLRPMSHPGLCRCARRVLPRLAPCRGGRPCGLNPSPSAQSRRNKPRTADNWQPLRQVTFPTHPMCTFTYSQCASSGFCSGCRLAYSRFRASRRLIEKGPSEGTRARPPTDRYPPDRVSLNKAAPIRACGQGRTAHSRCYGQTPSHLQNAAHRRGRLANPRRISGRRTQVYQRSQEQSRSRRMAARNPPHRLAEVAGLREVS